MMATVRLEDRADRAASIEVERAAFGSEQEPAIVEAVRDENGSFALVAEEDGAVVGHAQFSRAWIGDTPLLCLGPIGVRPDRHGRGIGSALMRAGLEEARARDEVAVLLFGEPGLYSRFGFRPGVTFGVPNPYAGLPLPGGGTVREENFMLAVLDDRAGSLSGEVRCHPALTFPVEADDPAV
jgi:putative acetyltransferase